MQSEFFPPQNLKSYLLKLNPAHLIGIMCRTAPVATDNEEKRNLILSNEDLIQKINVYDWQFIIEDQPYEDALKILNNQNITNLFDKKHLKMIAVSRGDLEGAINKVVSKLDAQNQHDETTCCILL